MVIRSSMPSFMGNRTFENLDGVIVAGFSLFICLLFFNQYWWGPDDGGYAYVASLILSGDVLHRDIQDIHPGYIHFINSFFLWLANGDMVGLRWPLVLITVLQSWLIYKLLKPHGYLQAATGAACMTAFGFIQFINPTPHWYTLTITVITAHLLTTFDKFDRRELLIIGALVGVAFMFRQLTGVILAVGVSGVLFYQKHHESNTAQGLTGPLLILVLALGLFLYLIKAANITGLIFLGFFPLLILLRIASIVRLSFLEVTKIVTPLFLGSIIVAGPIFIYHLMNGSLFHWIQDVFVTPFTLVSLPFFDQANFAFIPLVALNALLKGDINGLFGLIYWGPLLLAPSILGFFTFKKLNGRNTKAIALPVIASIYALISLHYEIPIYLVYSSGIILVACLYILPDIFSKNTVTIFILCLCMIATIFHAAPSVNRTFYDTITNHNQKEELAFLPNHSVQINKDKVVHYEKLISIIEGCTLQNEAIFTLPMSAELYFLSHRKSGLNFFMSSIGLTNENDLKSTIKRITHENGPSLIIHKINDKYNTPYAYRLINEVRTSFSHLGEKEGYDFFIKKDHADQQNCLRIINGSSNAI